MDTPYIFGREKVPDLPLGRFIPPIPGGMASAWCRKNLAPGDWVLDPLGFNPMVAIEVAQAGYPVLVTVNNPIHSFMLKVIASAPKEEALIAALQDLAIAPKGDERIEGTIRGLYTVTCADCKRQIEADAFLWEKGARQPFAAQVSCPYCGTVAEQEISDADTSRLDALPPIQLHRARALNRIVGRDEGLRAHVKNALNAYPARPLIILQTIINKLDSLEQSPRRRELLIALILSAADQVNTLWAHPTPRSRPRQIVVPNVYREKNLWKALEKAIKTWQVVQSPVPIQTWGERSAEPSGVYLYHGRIRELSPQPPRDFFTAVIATIPRPNQAFWTLSALWTGWIWGQEAVAPIRQVLARQRYDWNWHTNALNAIFDAIQPYYHDDLKIWGVIAENEPMLLLATLLAAETSHFTLSKYAFSSEDELAQCQWQKDNHPVYYTKPEVAIKIAREKVRHYLRKKGEPANYQKIHSAAITGLAYENQLAIDIFLQNPNAAASETQKWIETLFEQKDFLIRVGGGTASLETGEWWLQNPGEVADPMIDRLEQKVLDHLIRTEITDAHTVKETIYQSFQGIFTPQNKVLLICLESYAELIDSENHLWKLRENEKPEVRKAEVDQIREALKSIGKRLNYKTTGEDPILWSEGDLTNPVYRFFVFSTAIISKHIQKGHYSPRKMVLVFPGSRANLLAFKKQRNPLLSNFLDSGLIAVKFRLVRDLEANPLLSRELFNEQILVDPPEYRSSQLALF